LKDLYEENVRKRPYLRDTIFASLEIYTEDVTHAGKETAKKKEHN